MSDLLVYSDEEFFFAIRVHGSLDVVVTARGRNWDACSASHVAALSRRPKSERGRDYFGNVDSGLCEAAFAAAVLHAVAEVDFQCDGQVAGAYRIAA